MEASLWIDAAKAWARDRLPELNDSAYGGRMTADELAGLVNKLLSGAPLPRDFDGRQAMQALMILGVCGSSVERHTQQSQHRARQPVVPGIGLEKLVAANQPFVEYDAGIADRIGHIHRDW